MHRRLIVIALLLATALQGPALTYAATLRSTGGGVSMASACAGYVLANPKACEDCCRQGSMSSCFVQCAVPGTAMPVTSESSARIVMRDTLIPDAGVAPFVERDPSHPFRPPIV